jgi:hypothetical protein
MALASTALEFCNTIKGKTEIGTLTSAYEYAPYDPAAAKATGLADPTWTAIRRPNRDLGEILAVDFFNRWASLFARRSSAMTERCLPASRQRLGRRARLITLRNAQVRRIFLGPWGSAGAGAVRVASS